MPNQGGNRTGSANRSYTAGHFAFELDGVRCGFVRSVEGGAVSADTVVEKVGPDHIHSKHVGRVKYDEISVQVGFSMTQPFYRWVEDGFKNAYSRKNGAIIGADYKLNARRTTEFYNSLVTELTLPALDAAASK